LLIGTGRKKQSAEIKKKLKISATSAASHAVNNEKADQNTRFANVTISQHTAIITV